MSQANSYEEIGALLVDARKEMRLSLEQAASGVHIRARYLKALEEGDLSELPGLPYVKGYLQRYATFLQLDKSEVLRRFEQVEGTLEKRGFYLPDILSSSKTPERWVLLAGVGLMVAGFIGWRAFMQPDRIDISAWTVSVPAPQKELFMPWARPRNQACFTGKKRLYPPCYAEEPRFDLLPLKRQHVSVMDLAYVIKRYEP